ncbi:LysR substrate-binding domain-containing protein [Niveibacterium sp. SC-1]|uniref:LysR family transcriptional regulator n=1 Tax=Niveibacterium sp. SC-1 TaxID=3135646 RepID=UPI00311E2799
MARELQAVQLGSIELFLRAAEAGSFSDAARQLGLTPASVSRSVARLEARLGVRLFARSTRQVKLTEQGRLYAEHCREALGRIADVERELSGQRGVARGLLRVSLPTTYAHHRVLPLIPAFTARYPDLRLELHVGNRNIDFVEEGFDVAIRMGEPADSRLVARRLEDCSLGVFASPDYLARRGTPETPEDLPGHDCLPFLMPSSGRPLPWLFREAGRIREVAPHAPLQVSEDVLGCVGLARAGAGLTQIYHFIVAEDLAAGRLVEVLQDWSGCSRPFYLLHPHTRHPPAGLREFRDFLTAALAPPPVRPRSRAG